MSISRFPGHMRSIKLNFSATVLILGLKAKLFEKLNTLLSESFGGNCARAPRLTAVWYRVVSCPRTQRSTQAMQGVNLKRSIHSPRH